jgi:hypothetical protein
MDRRTEHQLVCGKRKCRNALQARSGFGRYHAPSNVVSAPKTSIKPGMKSGVAGDRPWRMVAGPELTPTQLHCATVPDGPDCRWEGGSWQHIEARNKAMLRAHFREKAAECLIQPHHPPVNVLGGYKFPDAPVVDLTPIEQAPIPTTNPLYPDTRSLESIPWRFRDSCGVRCHDRNETIASPPDRPPLTVSASPRWPENAARPPRATRRSCHHARNRAITPASYIQQWDPYFLVEPF